MPWCVGSRCLVECCYLGDPLIASLKIGMNMREWLERHWPWLLTLTVFVVAITLLFTFRDLNEIDHIGSFIAGFSGALASIWLVAAYLLQTKELQLQRRELALQRESLNAQREELHRIGKFAALEQTYSILRQYEETLSRSQEGTPKTVQELPVALSSAMRTWKVILQSGDNSEVRDSYMQWLMVIGACKEFLNRVVSAIELYQEATNEELLVYGDDSAATVVRSISRIKNIPFIRNYIGTADMLAELIYRLEPGIDTVELRGIEAIEALMPGVVRSETFEKVRKKVAQHQQRREKGQQ